MTLPGILVRMSGFRTSLCARERAQEARTAVRETVVAPWWSRLEENRIGYWRLFLREKLFLRAKVAVGSWQGSSAGALGVETGGLLRLLVLFNFPNFRNRPGVYTRISEFRSWIRNVIENWAWSNVHQTAKQRSNSSQLMTGADPKCSSTSCGLFHAFVIQTDLSIQLKPTDALRL